MKIVNHPRGGRVAAIHVREGQQVAAGTSWSPSTARSPAASAASSLGRLQLRKVEVARLEAEAAGPGAGLGARPNIAPDLLAAQQALLEARNAAQTSRREALAKAMQTRRGEMRTAAAEVERLRNSLELLKQQREAVQELADRGLYPALKVVQVERQYSDDLGELAKAKASLDAAEAALAEAASRAEGLETERLSEVLGQLAAGDGRPRPLGASSCAPRTRSWRAWRSRRRRPASSRRSWSPHRARRWRAHETLMKLVPAGEGLVVQAKVANQDVGRLRPGMPATVKVRAFDYLRFGTLDGVLQKVAADATPDPRTGELTYAVTVVTARAHLGAAPGEFDVAPGMAVDVDLKIGERTILSYLTDRIFRLQEAFREG